MEESTKKGFKKISRKILIVLIAFTLYSNIGWMMGSYYYHHVVMERENLTTLGKVAAGGWSFFSTADPAMRKTAEFGASVIFGVIWPIGLAFVIISWIAYCFYYGIYYAGWFIFAGGAARLLGLVSH